MHKKSILYGCLLGSLLLNSPRCKRPAPMESLQELMARVESIGGREDYLSSPFVTAGDRVYMVGHQDGQFPDLGWHVAGEMGGIWDHPIKLMDGFTATISENGEALCLAEADSFVNFPFANKHIYLQAPGGLEVERFQFVPDGKEAVVVEFTFRNPGHETKNITFDFTGHIDLRPVWLGERTGMVDGGDFATWDRPSGCWVGKDSLNDWFVLFGADARSASHEQQGGACEFRPIGKGVSATVSFDLEVPANGAVSLPFTIAGSYRSLEEAKATFENVKSNAPQLLRDKKARYRAIAQKSNLTIPDKDMQQVFEWLKYNTDWLVRDVPETGRGLSAGLPDYPWWFGADSEYALLGAIATGQKELVYSTIDLIHQVSEKTNGNGRIIHEVSTNGAVFNPGNINETPQFVSLIWSVYQWTGDRAFLEKYFPTVKKSLDWLLRENDADGNLLPDGFGMMEIHGLDSEMIDVAVYTQKAFADAAEMALEMGDNALAEQYSGVAGQLRVKINTDYWVPEFNSFADFIGTTEQALHLIKNAIVRADTLKKPWAVEELKATKKKIEPYPPLQKQGFVVHHNWVVNTPMETGVADADKALLALETGRRFVNPFGMFVTGIDRDKTAGDDTTSFAKHKKVFSYTGAVMTLPTGVQAVAENNYGRPDMALDYLKRMTRSFSYALPGSMYEVSPDFGMMAQAWNIYAFAVPIVQQFFGIRPRAAQKTVRIQPQMPTAWESASLENITVGDNEISVTYARSGRTVELTILQTKEDWKVQIVFPAGQFQKWEANGAEAKPGVEGSFQTLEASGKRIALKLQE